MNRPARKFLLGVALLACAVAPAVQSRAQTGPARPVGPPRPAGHVEQDPKAWKKLAPVGGNFTMLLPGTPSAETNPVETAAGKLDNRVFSVQTKLAVYMVAYADFPDAVSDADTIQRMLDGGRDKALANTKGKLKSEKNIKLGTYAGREWVIEVPGGIIARARAYWVGRRLFQALVIMPEETKLSPEAIRIREGAAAKFFDSFALGGASAAAAN